MCEENVREDLIFHVVITMIKRRRKSMRINDAAALGVTPHVWRLLQDRHFAFEVPAGQAPEFLQHIQEFHVRVTDLRDLLARRVPSSTRILARPMREVRAVLRLDTGGGFNFDNARERIRGDSYAVRRFLADLVTDEWLVQDAPDHWIATQRAKELQFKSRGRLGRMRAEGLLSELLHRVREANEDPKLAYKIDAVVVYGSYLSGRDRIGDVDVAIKLRPRLQAHQAQEALENQARDRGPHFRNIVESICWPQIEVLRFLKARSPWLDVKSISDLEGLFRSGARVSHEVLFGYWVPPSQRTQPDSSTVHTSSP